MELAPALEAARSARIGALVTLKRDGRPQLSNVSFAVTDDGVIRVSITADRAKTANARRDPRVSLYVTSPDFRSYFVIEGRADLAPTAEAPDDATVDELVEQYRAVAGEHPDWGDYRRAMVADRRLVLRLHPERAYGMLPG
jgi:PPOX class probable F420-dependent enzyme